MEAIRKIIHIKSNTIDIDELSQFKGKDVEVIILPVDSQKRKLDKKKFFEFCGVYKSGMTDTSRKIDELVYGF